MKRISKGIKFTFLMASISLFVSLPVLAADPIVPGLKPINLPLFGTIKGLNTQFYSVFSWLSFIGALATIGLVIFWIYLILRAAIQALRSEGKPEGLSEAWKKMRSIFLGAAITFAFPVALTIIGAILGIGNIFQWPKMFSFCNSSTTTSDQYYFQVYLKNDSDQAKADAICGVS